MNKKMNRIVSGLLAASFAVSGAVVPAFAVSVPTPGPGSSNVGPGAPDGTAAQKKEPHPNDEDMGFVAGNNSYQKIVTPLGKNSFYRIKSFSPLNPYNTYIVEYASSDDGSKDGLSGDTWHAIPAEYMNKNFTEPSAFGAYVVNNGAGGKPQVVFVKIAGLPIYDGKYGAVQGQNISGDCYIYNHGTPDGATVSGSLDRAQTGSQDDNIVNESNRLGTDFYLRVEHTLDDRNEKTEVSSLKADQWVLYDISVAIATQYNLDVTIPMYICMYGYGASGNVITPDKDAYQMKNYSSINYGDSAYIKEIVQKTIYTSILDTNHTNAKINTIAYVPTRDSYIWFFSEPTQKELQDAFTAIDPTIDVSSLSLASPNVYQFTPDDPVTPYITASGEFYAFYDHKAQVAGENNKQHLWDFKANGVLEDIEMNGKMYRGTRKSVQEVDINHPLSAPFTHTTLLNNGDKNKKFTFEFGTERPFVGLTSSSCVLDEPLAVRVSELQATPATWTLVPLSKQGLSASEIAMSLAPNKASHDISAIDLSTCSDRVNITNRGWLIDAPEMEPGTGKVDVTKPGKLPLITHARIAGDNINALGCTSVVHVEYTVTPVCEINDVQVNTDTGIENNDNSNAEGPYIDFAKSHASIAPGALVPQDCQYMVAHSDRTNPKLEKWTYTILNPGERLPDAPQRGDRFITPEYEYRYRFRNQMTADMWVELNADGWGVARKNRVRDQEKFSHKICESILGKNVISAYAAFVSCSNLKAVDDDVFPATIEDIDYAFYHCNSLLKAPNLPANAPSMIATFSDCRSLSGTIKIYLTTGMFSSDVFENVSEKDVTLVAAANNDSVVQSMKQHGGFVRSRH